MGAHQLEGIEATTALYHLPCLPSGARTLPLLGEEVVAAKGCEHHAHVCDPSGVPPVIFRDLGAVYKPVVTFFGLV